MKADKPVLPLPVNGSMTDFKKQFTTLIETSYPSLMTGVDRDLPILDGVKVVAANAKFPREILPDESVIESLQELAQWIRDNVVMG